MIKAKSTIIISNRLFLFTLLYYFRIINAQYYSQYDPNSYANTQYQGGQQYQYQQPVDYNWQNSNWQNNNWQQYGNNNNNNNFGWREVPSVETYQNPPVQYQEPVQLTPQVVQENIQWQTPQQQLNPNNQWMQYPQSQPENQNQFITQTQFVDPNQNQNQFINQNQNQNQNQFITQTQFVDSNKNQNQFINQNQNQNQFINQNQNQIPTIDQNIYVNQFQEPVTTKEAPKVTTAKLETMHNMKDLGNTVVNDDCMKCLCFIESWCSDVGCVMDQGSLSCGWYQLKYEYWLDCGQPGGDWVKCSNSKSCAEGCVKQYMNRYGVFCANNNGGPPRCQDLARIHNGGPYGCSSNSTEYYGWLISRCLKRESPYENIDSYNIPVS